MNIFSVFCIHRQRQAVIKKTAGVFFVLILLFSFFPQKTYAISTNPSGSFNAGTIFNIYCDNPNDFFRIYIENTKYYANSGNDCTIIENEIDEGGQFTIVEVTTGGSSPDNLDDQRALGNYSGETTVQIIGSLTPTDTPTPTEGPTDTPTNTPTPSPIPSSSTTTQVIYVSPTPNPTTHTLTPTPNPARKLTNTPTPNGQVLGQSTAPAELAQIADNRDQNLPKGNSSPSFIIFLNIVALFLLFICAISFLYTKHKEISKVFQGLTSKVKAKIYN